MSLLKIGDRSGPGETRTGRSERASRDLAAKNEMRDRRKEFALEGDWY